MLKEEAEQKHGEHVLMIWMSLWTELQLPQQTKAFGKLPRVFGNNLISYREGFLNFEIG